MIRHRHTRSGFTLIELLVVVGILALLAALTMSGVTAVRNRQMANATAQSIGKLQEAIDSQVKVLVDQAVADQRNRTSDYVKLLAYCDNDSDRALSLLGLLKLRHAFPQTYAEATSNVSIPAAGINWPPHKVYATVPNISAWSPEEQSAALLNIGISGMGAGGLLFASDDGTAGNNADWASGGTTAKVYTDAWKRPICFKRFYEDAVLNAAPYTNAKSNKRDPFDPLGKLAAWTPVLVPNANTTAQTVTGALFDNNNKVITPYSWGPDKKTGTGDEILGYTLRQLGSGGAPGAKQ